MSESYIDELLNSATDEQKAQLLAALADDFDVEVEIKERSGLDSLGKALSNGPSITGGGDKTGEEPEEFDDLAKAFGGGQ